MSGRASGAIARERQIEPGDAAVEQQWLDAVEVDAVKTLCRPKELAPGYEVTGLLGRGAMGVVYRAVQLNLGREVALKTINLDRMNQANAVSRIEREARLVARLRHPNVVTAHDFGIHQGRMFISMELAMGEDLQSRIERMGRMPENEALGIVRQVAAALAHANEQGVVHRDIKPANILLTKPPEGTANQGSDFVKVTDFGLAACTEPSGDARLTSEGAALGTPAYVAPEQLRDAQVDSRADIFALGATLLHMLTGVAPFEQKKPLQVMLSKSLGDDGWREGFPSDASAEVKGLFLAMTETDPEQRLSDYATLIARIDKTLDRPPTGPPREALDRMHAAATVDAEVPLPRKPPVVEEKQRLTQRKSKRWIVVGVLGVLILLAAAGLYWRATRHIATPIAEQSLAPAAPLRSLFNGDQVPKGRQRGVWSIANDADDAPVLSGEDGELTIDLAPEAPTYRIRVSVELQVDAEVELEFGRRGDARLAIRIAEGSAELGSHGEQDFRAFENVPPLALSRRSGEGPNYQRILLTRQEDGWLVNVNGQRLGSVAAPSGSPPPLILRCTGAALFADMDLAVLGEG